VSDEDALAAVVERVLAENPKAAADVRAGRTQAIGPLIGKVIAATGGQADPRVARELLGRRLAG
jgi:aspartyl-tRNA(Asn)/glutamyl-tRNA(Gln) amidotransferase subunit B